MNILQSFAGAIMLACAFSITLTAATEQQAEAITSEYDQARRLWLAELKLAPNAAALEVIKKKQPDPTVFAKQLKRLLNRDLDKEWSLKYGAWLLENDGNLTPGSQRALLNAVEQHHIKSPKLGRFAFAMIYLNQGDEAPRPGKVALRSRGMKLLERIKAENPDKKVQGQAALALSLMYASLGDDANVMRKRIENLREAIVKSALVKMGDKTVADIAKEQLFIINNLTKGRQAPNIVGNDSAGLPVQLKDYQGKVVMLVFWSSFDTELDRMRQALEMLRKTNTAKAGQPFSILGVNRDTLENLRALEADRIATWRNISDPKQEIGKAYHITIWPYCMVLDKQGVIRYSGPLGAFADAVATDLLSAKPVKP